MYKAEVDPYKGKVVLLDLVSGLQITAEIVSVDEYNIYCERAVIFQVNTEPTDPSLPPSDMNPIQQKLNAVPFGGPFTQPKKNISFDLRHVIAIHTPIDPIEKAYVQVTSGIQLADANTISQLNKSGLR